MTVKIRPKVLSGWTYELETGCGSLYVTINEDAEGKTIELFPTIGKGGGCAASQCEAIGRMASLAFRCGASPARVIKELQGISCHLPQGYGDEKVFSCADGIAKALVFRQEDKKEEKLSEHTKVV